MMGVCNMLVKIIVILKLFKIFTNFTLGESEELITIVVSIIACHMCDLQMRLTIFWSQLLKSIPKVVPFEHFVHETS